MKIKTSEVKKIIDEEFIKVAREVRRLTESETARALTSEDEAARKRTQDRIGAGMPAPIRSRQKPMDTEPAVQQIEGILKDLLDQGLDNEGLKKILTQIIHDIDKGFVGEPT
jgi:hypothetical protein